MSVFLLILGLLPLAILPEIMSASDDDEGPDSTDLQAPEILNPVETDDLLSPDPEPVDPDLVLAPETDQPDTPDDQPVTTDPLVPVTEVESPHGTLALDFSEVTASGYVEIENFDAESDVLTILIEQGALEGQVDLEILSHTNPDDAEVWLEGQLVAVLKNAAEADQNNIQITLKG